MVARFKTGESAKCLFLGDLQMPERALTVLMIGIEWSCVRNEFDDSELI